MKCPECGRGNLWAYQTAIKTFTFKDGKLFQETEWREDEGGEIYFSCVDCDHEWREWGIHEDSE